MTANCNGLIDLTVLDENGKLIGTCLGWQFTEKEHLYLLVGEVPSGTITWIEREKCRLRVSSGVRINKQ